MAGSPTVDPGARDGGLDAEPRPTFYADYRQRPFMTFDFTLVLHTSVEPTSVVADARRVISELAPEAPPRFRTVTEVVSGSTAGRRFTFALTGFFATAAMLLAVLGVYGVLSYLVAQRSHELGIRMALGARPFHVYRLVLGEAFWLVGLGLVLGVAAALAMARVLDGMLFGVTSTDGLTYVTVALGLALAALAASQLPAIRATHADPMRALRAE
ncbi:MAG: FtsX-like permease family protein [Luteitalea sp.]|nr:FtsX-like permease family protein [Luteitalea sp.]